MKTYKLCELMCGMLSSTMSPLFKKIFNSAISTNPEGHISDFTKIFQYKVLQFKCISYYFKKQVNLLLNLRYLNKFCNGKCSLQSTFPQGRNHMTFREQEHVIKLCSELNKTKSLREHVQFFHFLKKIVLFITELTNAYFINV